MAAIQSFTTNMGKRLELKVSGRYREVAAIRRWPHVEVRPYYGIFSDNYCHSKVWYFSHHSCHFDKRIFFLTIRNIQKLKTEVKFVKENFCN